MSKNNNIHDLLKNTSFLKWLKKEAGANDAHWEKWQRQSTKNERLSTDAAMIEKGIPFQKQKKNHLKTKASWTQLSKKLATTNTKSIPLSPRRNWLKIAATLTIVILVSLGISTYFNQAKLIEHQTGFAQNETFLLPDGTEVVLAANSSLSYYEDLEKRHTRKVELNGAAYFNVANQPNGKHFEVQLKDLTVAVIGTQFNVNSYRPHSIISLMEGAIDLKKTGIPTQPLLPGQTAVFNAQNSTFDILANQTDYWSTWRFQKWSFGEGTPLKEVIQRIEETFGLTVHVEDPVILSKQASGDIAIDNQEVLFESLAYLLNVTFKVKGADLFISDKVENEE